MEPSQLTGVALKALYDLGKNTLSRALKKDVVASYQLAVNKVSKKYAAEYGGDLEVPIRHVFASAFVRRQIRSFTKGREDVLESIKSKASDFVAKKYKTLPWDKIVEEFFTEFTKKLAQNEELTRELQHQYHTITVGKLDAMQSSIGDVGKDVKDLKKAFVEKFIEQATIRVVQSPRMPQAVGGFQVRIYNQKYQEYIKNLNQYQYSSSTGLTSKLVPQNGFAVGHYIPDENTNTIRLEHDGQPYKIIYPPVNSAEFWIKEEKDYIEVTCFTENYRVFRDMTQILQDCIRGNGMLKKMCFNVVMKKLLTQHLGQTTTIHYDPYIKGTLDVEGIRQEVSAKNAMLSGEKGIMNHARVKELIKSFKKIKKGQVASIYYFKVVSSKKFDGQEEVTFDVHHDGRIMAYFHRKKYTYTGMKDAVHSFLKTNTQEE